MTVGVTVEDGKFKEFLVTPTNGYEASGDFGSKTYFEKAVNGTTMPNRSFRFRAYTVPPLYTTQILLAGHLNLTKYTVYFIATTINYFYAEPVALEKVNLPDNMD